jgi:hypothetical protein
VYIVGSFVAWHSVKIHSNISHISRVWACFWSRWCAVWVSVLSGHMACVPPVRIQVAMNLSKWFHHTCALPFLWPLLVPKGAGTAWSNVTKQLQVSEVLCALQDGYDGPCNTVDQLYSCCTCSSGRCDTFTLHWMNILFIATTCQWASHKGCAHVVWQLGRFETSHVLQGIEIYWCYVYAYSLLTLEIKQCMHACQGTDLCGLNMKLVSSTDSRSCIWATDNE